MKLRTIACLIGALAISSAPFVVAVTGGGFPSQPTFLTINNGGANSVSCNGSGTVLCSSESSASAWAGVFSSTATAGNQRGLLVSMPAGSTSGDTALRINDNNGTTVLNVDGAGTTTIGSTSTNPLKVNTTGAAGLNAAAIFNGISGANSGVFFQLGGIEKGAFCISGATNQCATGESAGDVTIRSSSTAMHFSINSGSSDALKIDGSGNITAPAAASVPWAKPPCIIKITFSGTTPSVNSSSGCASPGISRGSVGSYTFTDANITGLIGVCTPNSSSSGPYLQDLVSIGGGSALVNNFAVPGSTASVLADIPSGASLTCRFDR